ncbi:SecY-interacting protein [Thalassomonas sp. M1454]|uniref:SecY-interacting protein n=1 Tax=Thalassomonas sp. M1454 TaxID=2594477 RepID=UPI0011812297|nr:SecY-interacting protein [Thalassomonas sp. M1454]TRX57068.1 SecY-interacting protein [Thalassomonas sp. M1454]
MNTSQQSLSNSIEQLLQQFIDTVQATKGALPEVEQDSEWISPCEQGQINAEGIIAWQPVAVDDELGFENVEKAIGYTIHNDIKTFFTSFYSDVIPAKCEHGELELLFTWNKDDFERLQQNIIGHLLMKQRLKQEPTLFFAVTDEDDINLVIKNDSGEVWVEPVGCEPKTLIAASLQEFIGTLSINYSD